MKRFLIFNAVLFLLICSACSTANNKTNSAGVKPVLSRNISNEDILYCNNGKICRTCAIDNSRNIYSGTNPNSYRGIPVDVTGLPYEYKDIKGSHSMDYLIEASYKMFSTGQWATFINFRFDKFIYDFKNDGSLILKTVYSHDRTPAGGNSFYPASSSKVHEWKLTPSYHQHLGSNCSLDRYNDIAISQVKLNEMRKDSSLGKIYCILLSVAQDMDYDYNRVGMRVKFVTPTPLTGVCDDYSNLLISRLQKANITGVTEIKKVSGQNHAWVTLNYKGRLLYLDATWFDTNVVDETGTVVNIPYKDPRDMTFDRDIFTNHGKHRMVN